MHAPSALTRWVFWPLHLPVARSIAAASPLLAARAILCSQQTLCVVNGSQEVTDRVGSAGAVSTFATLPCGTDAAGIAFDAVGNRYVADGANNRILQTGVAGVVDPAPFAHLPNNYGVNGLAFDCSGNLYAARDLSQPLMVAYKAKGTAVAGVDYKGLPGSVTIPAGADRAAFKVKALRGGAADGPAALILKVSKAAGGAVQPGAGKATVLINP